MDLCLTRVKASLREITLAATKAAYSPKEWPAKQTGFPIFVEIKRKL